MCRELLAGDIASGSAATAHEAALTTKMPVAIAAAGRSQPNHPARLGSGRNLSMTASDMAVSQAPLSSNGFQPAAPRPGAIRQREALAARRTVILARIRSSPSAAGSTDSAAVISASRSARSKSPSNDPEV